MIELKVVQPDPYDAVLADLRAKRDAIDNTIATLESLRAGRLGVAPVAAAPAEQDSTGDEGQFLGMSIVDATKKLLSIRKRSMGNAEILKDLQAGGLILSSAEPMNVVGSVLMRRFNNVGDIVRVRRGVWGLKEWYPGRNFKPAGKGGGDHPLEATSGAGEPAPPADDFDDLIGERTED